jgi:hypothetical protein
MEAVYLTVVGVFYGKKPFGRLSVNGSIILKWTLEI